MGIDKSDIQSVIHYDMPRSIENYVQEIGRAGRDGKLARCHMFVHDEDFYLLRKLLLVDLLDFQCAFTLTNKVILEAKKEFASRHGLLPDEKKSKKRGYKEFIGDIEEFEHEQLLWKFYKEQPDGSSCILTD